MTPFVCRSPRCACHRRRPPRGQPRVARPWFYDWESRILHALDRRSSTRAVLALRLAGVRAHRAAFDRALAALEAAGRVCEIVRPGWRVPRLRVR